MKKKKTKTSKKPKLPVLRDCYGEKIAVGDELYPSMGLRGAAPTARLVQIHSDGSCVIEYLKPKYTTLSKMRVSNIRETLWSRSRR